MTSPTSPLMTSPPFRVGKSWGSGEVGKKPSNTNTFNLPTPKTSLLPTHLVPLYREDNGTNGKRGNKGNRENRAEQNRTYNLPGSRRMSSAGGSGPLSQSDGCNYPTGKTDGRGLLLLASGGRGLIDPLARLSHRGHP